MRFPLLMSAFATVLAAHAAAGAAAAAEVDARPPDRLTLGANGSRFNDTHDQGAGGSLNWLHYLTANAIVGVGAEHQYIEDAKWTFGSLRGSWGRGEPASRFS